MEPEIIEDKTILKVIVKTGRSTPYYYHADGVMETYIRIGNESIVAPNNIVNELILKGTNQSFDALITGEKKTDYSFTLLSATYRERTGLTLESSVPVGTDSPRVRYSMMQ